jgi:hypothetical protein
MLREYPTYYQHNERTTRARPTDHYYTVLGGLAVRSLDRHIYGTRTMSRADLQHRRFEAESLHGIARMLHQVRRIRRGGLVVYV